MNRQAWIPVISSTRPEVQVVANSSEASVL
jgi:hypothetical protein